MRIASSLPNTVYGKYVARQIATSATGSGANYEEARAAESRSDFVHKLSIALKKSRETLYWLQLIEKSDLSKSSLLSTQIREANELVAILTSSIKTAKANQNPARYTRKSSAFKNSNSNPTSKFHSASQFQILNSISRFRIPVHYSLLKIRIQIPYSNSRSFQIPNGCSSHIPLKLRVDAVAGASRRRAQE